MPTRKSPLTPVLIGLIPAGLIWPPPTASDTGVPGVPCAISIALTFAIELPILLLLVRYAFRFSDLSIRRTLVAGVLASSFTLPAVLFMSSYLRVPLAHIVIAEFVVFVVEAVILKLLLRTTLPQAALLSFVTNAFSFLAGLALFGLLW